MSLFSMAGLEGKMTSNIGDIRDFAALKAAFDAARPEIVFHMATQPIVRDSYKAPVYTYEVNVMHSYKNIDDVARVLRLIGENGQSLERGYKTTTL